MTAGFIGTAECIATARVWLSRAAEGVDGDGDHHPFCGFQLTGPFASQLRTNGPEAKITASEIRELTADGLKRLDGFNHLLGLIDDRLAQLSSLDAPPTIVFITLPAEIVKRYRAVHQTKQGVETVWNLRAGIKARAMQRSSARSCSSRKPSNPTSIVYIRAGSPGRPHPEPVHRGLL